MTRDTDLIRRSLLNIREISMTIEDEYGNPWVESHMIEREVAAALAALSAPVQEPPSPGVTAGATGDVIMQGLSDDTTGLARFGHHPDPATDFCIEVETLESRLHQAEHGLSKPGTEPETVAAVLVDIQRAMDFRVGGDEGAVNAKHILRGLEARATPAPSQLEAEPVVWQQRLANGRWVTILHGNDKPIGEAVPLYAQPVTPAPVVPAEGPISTLEMVYRNMPDIPELPEAYQPRNIARNLAALRSAPTVGGDMGNPITMIYRNYRGEVAERTVVPRRIWWGSTDWHPEPGWLMSAYDPDKGADRDFALADCDFRRIAPPVGARVAWIATADRLPEKPGKRSYEQIECLIKLPNGDIEVSMWNCEHMCWDDADGDDFRFDPGQPSHWMPLAPIRAALLPAGEGEE